AKLFRERGADAVVRYVKGPFAGTSETLGECVSLNANGGVSNWASHGRAANRGAFLQTDLFAELSANGGQTSEVGAYPPNSLGLYDMAGNAWDLTSSQIIATNGLERGVLCYAVRGGSWYATARSCAFSYRGEGRKNFPSSTVGFRVAADAPDAPDAPR
ncbi:MAG: SUMF1/EgtB/PvdO family nonheme iron enzyme, partial [Thermoguttaceae bacterium]|nr:SUMF1/EgtB/PvdO family nonheme iron enzyme [Thermoguttaceae bacterium]